MPPTFFCPSDRIICLKWNLIISHLCLNPSVAPDNILDWGLAVWEGVPPARSLPISPLSALFLITVHLTLQHQQHQISCPSVPVNTPYFYTFALPVESLSASPLFQSYFPSISAIMSFTRLLSSLRAGTVLFSFSLWLGLDCKKITSSNSWDETRSPTNPSWRRPGS